MRTFITNEILSRVARPYFHHPISSETGEKIHSIPYLTLPFRKEDLLRCVIRSSQPNITKRQEYSISEGWFYSKRVRKVNPVGHSGVDFELPFGFPVAAPCRGFAMSSYESYPLTDSKGNPVKDKKGAVNFGLGYFVQIYNPDEKRIVQLGHLCNISENIPFMKPEKVGNKWKAKGHLIPPSQMMSGVNPYVKEVEIGDPIGWVGYSGLTYLPDYFEGMDRPYVINPEENGTWSIPHIHMDESERDPILLTKARRRDPYNEYSMFNVYPTHRNRFSIREEGLFLIEQNGKPKFADEV